MKNPSATDKSSEEMLRPAVRAREPLLKSIGGASGRSIDEAGEVPVDAIVGGGGEGIREIGSGISTKGTLVPVPANTTSGVVGRLYG